jgi:8-oxo-dGTP pyrophosphatase MutT (NUDIX family)
VRAPSIHLGVRATAVDVVRRRAVKAVVEVDGRLLMLRSRSGGDYKFPGGGADPGEDDDATLARELDEECGRDVLEVGRLALVVIERHPDLERPDAVFEMESRYYDATVGPTVRPPRLTGGEQSVGLHAEWVGWDHAVDAGRAALARGGHPSWVGRELQVLQFLARERGLARP